MTNLLTDLDKVGLLADLVPKDMDLPTGRLTEVNISNVSWLCRNIQVRNSGHPEIKQTLAKLNMLRQKIALGQMT